LQHDVNSNFFRDKTNRNLHKHAAISGDLYGRTTRLY